MATKQTYKMMKLDTRLRTPPPTNPINTTSTVLFLNAYKTWTNYWFGIAREQGVCKVGNVEFPPIPQVLSPTGGCTVCLKWTYDDEVSFNIEA